MHAHARVAAAIALTTQLLEHPLGRDRRITAQQILDGIGVGIELPFSSRLRRLLPGTLAVQPCQHPPYHAARHCQVARDLPLGLLCLPAFDNLVAQLFGHTSTSLPIKSTANSATVCASRVSFSQLGRNSCWSCAVTSARPR